MIPILVSAVPDVLLGIELGVFLIDRWQGLLVIIEILEVRFGDEGRLAILCANGLYHVVQDDRPSVAIILYLLKWPVRAAEKGL